MNSLLIVSALASTLQLTAPCSSTVVYDGPVSGSTVGAATIGVLKSQAIEFKGNELGLASVFNTPTGDQAIEVIGNGEIRAYGWCYEVDGVQPSKMPGEVSLEGVKTIRWFYGSAHYKNGQWISYCDRSTEKTPPQFCGGAR